MRERTKLVGTPALGGRRSGQLSYPVVSVTYRVAVRLGRDGSHVALAVTYEADCGREIVESVYFEAPPASCLRGHAEQWWAARSGAPCPTDSVEAFQLASAGRLPKPSVVSVESSARQDNVPVIRPTFESCGPRQGPSPIGSSRATRLSRSSRSIVAGAGRRPSPAVRPIRKEDAQ